MCIVCVPSVYFIINFKRGLATTRNTHSICQVAWILFFIGFSVVFFPVFRSWLLAAFVITFCGFVAAFLNAVCYMLDSVFCVLCTSTSAPFFLIANANYSYAALCSHNYRLLPHQITGWRGQLAWLKKCYNEYEWNAAKSAKNHIAVAKWQLRILPSAA